MSKYFQYIDTRRRNSKLALFYWEGLLLNLLLNSLI